MTKRPPRYDLPNAAPGLLRLVQLFLNSSSHDTGLELLGTPAQLAGWFAERQLPIERVGPAALQRAWNLRVELRALVAGQAPGPNVEDAVRRARITIDLTEPRLVPQAQGLDGALGLMLIAVYDSIRDGTWSRLKTCRNCGWAYWDNSKNRSGAWCSMQLCGSRLKVRRYRDRQRAA